MIYLQQTFDLHPASPATRDRFVEHAGQTLVPAWAELGGRLKAAFFSTEEWFYQVAHVTAFDDLAAFDRARAAIESDPAFAALRQANEELAPTRGDTLFESLGVVADEKLDEGITLAADKPSGEYTYAILEVAPALEDELLHVGRRPPLVAIPVEVERHGARTGNPDEPETGARDQYQAYEVVYASGERAGVPGREDAGRWHRAAARSSSWSERGRRQRLRR